jgi:hypothetical protein
LELLSQNDAEQEEICKAESTNDLLQIENKLLEDRAYVRHLKKHFTVIGLTCKDARQHVNCALDSVMNSDVQLQVNVLYGNNVHSKQYVDHLSLKHDLPNLFAVMLQVISKSWTAAEKVVRTYMSDWLKNAPKRAKNY